MARKKIPRSLIASAEDAASGEDQPAPAPPVPVSGAWRAGATAQLRADLDALETDAVARVLAGQSELRLDPAQIDDPLGSDRRADWRDQPGFAELRASIEANGQDQPIHVAPEDADWRPDPHAPHDAQGARFQLLAGRRRLAALQELGRPVRAIIAPVAGAGQARRFDMLARRWRENAEREDLSPFEQLLSIGEMYEAAAAAAVERSEPRPTAVAFAAQIGVSQSVISRARAVSRRREAILAGLQDPYALSMAALYALLPTLDAPGPKAAGTAKKTARPAPLRASRKAGALTVKAEARAGAITLRATGAPRTLDRAALEALIDRIIREIREEGM